MADKCKVVCNYHRERRGFTAKDAGRVVCYAREGGATWTEIKREAGKRCGPIEETECDCARLEATLRLAQTALALAVLAIGLIVTKGKVLPKVTPIVRKALERGITIEGEIIPELKALTDAVGKGKVASETLTKAINELSLAQREAFAMREVIIKP